MARGFAQAIVSAACVLLSLHFADALKGSNVESCASALAELANLTYIDRQTSLKMVEASGTELYSIGNVRACGALAPNAAPCVLETAIDWQGLCAPSACAAPGALSATLKLSNKTTVRCGMHSYGAPSSGFWSAILVIGAIVVISVYATAVDLGAFDGDSTRSDDLSDQLSPLVDEEGETSEDATAKAPRSLLVTSFSIARSYEALFDFNDRRKHVLDGLRALSLSWIILGHTINFMLDMGMSNPLDFFPLNDNNSAFACSPMFSVFIVSASFAVDTFFFLSSFLLTMVTLRRIERGRDLPVLLAIANRYARLVPTLGFAIMLFTLIVPYMGSGPVSSLQFCAFPVPQFNRVESNWGTNKRHHHKFWYLVTDMVGHCNKNWWTNLLFVNNFYPPEYKEQCVPWTVS